ncbi:MAG: hypothetical protein HYR94_19685 [Chloroflexi bacterium]|nr:hypothetical protein [Chloroflexota bacterium]
MLLDGLDEVADLESRRKVVNWVEWQMIAHAKNRFVITSRPFGYLSNPVSRVTVLQVRPFTSEQVQRFVYNWYQANEIMSTQKDDPGVAMKAQEGAEDLLQRLRGAPVLLDLAVNPLLLTMIATVHRYHSSLPERRVELYAEICEVFLGKRQQARGLELDMTPAQKQRVLQPLAYYMMEQEIREISLATALVVIAEPLQLVSPTSNGTDFLKMIENSSGLLLEQESGEYSFAHLTFQEYLAAAHAQDQKLVSELVKHIEKSWWHETIRLYAAQANATPIIEACLTDDKPSISKLTLAIECDEEGREVSPQVRTQLKTFLEKGIEETDPDRWLIIAEALLSLRLRRMTTFKGKGKEYVVGIRPSDADAFCSWLTQCDPDNWHYRLSGDGEFDIISFSDEVKNWLKNGSGYWIQSNKGFEFRISNPKPAIEYPMLEHLLFLDFNYAFSIKHKPVPQLEADLKIAGFGLVQGLHSILEGISKLQEKFTTAYTSVNNLKQSISAEITQIRSQEQALEAGIANLPELRDDIDKKLGQFRQRESELNREFNQTSRQIRDLDNEIATKQRQESDLNSRKTQILREENNLNSELYKIPKQMSGRDSERAAKQQQESNLKAKISEIDEIQNELNSGLKKSFQLSIDLEREVARKNEQRKSLVDKFNQICQQRSDLLEAKTLPLLISATQLNQEETDLRGRLDKLEQEEMDLRGRIDKVDQEKDRKKDELEQVKQDINKRKKDLAEYDWKKAKPESELKRVSQDISELNNKLKQLDQRRDELKIKLYELDREKKELEAESSQISQKVSNLNNELKRLHKLKDKLETELHKIGQEKDTLDKDLDNAQNLEFSHNLVHKYVEALQKGLKILDNQKFSTALNLQSVNVDQVQQYLESLVPDLRKVQSELEKFSQLHAQNLEPVKNVKNIIYEVESLLSGSNFVIKQIDGIFHVFQGAQSHYSSFNLKHTLEKAKNYYGQPSFASLERGLRRLPDRISRYIPENNPDLHIFSRFLCRYIRLGAFALVIQLLSESSSMQGRDAKPGKKVDQHLLDTALNLYLEFTLLEQRIQGNLPALEGIWIVKERKQEYS